MPKLAVLCDLHCHPESDTPAESFLLTDQLRSPETFHPVQSLLRLVANGGLAADILLVGGDITNKISQQGFLSGWAFAKEIGTALGASVIAATIGNHDVDSRHVHSSDPFKIPRQLSPDFPVSDLAEQTRFWQQGFYAVRSGQTLVLVVNSVLAHHNEEDAKRGAISEQSLESLHAFLGSLGNSTYRVALTHHHPMAHENLRLGSEDLMENGSILLDTLSQHGFQLVVHGHKHHPRLSYAPGAAYSPTVFAAGSFSAFSPRMLSNTRNLFHIVTLEESVLTNCTKHGVVQSWEYNWGRGWSPPSPRSADFSAVAGFGCRVSGQQTARTLMQKLTFTPGSYHHWSTVLDTVPEITYLIPADLLAFKAELLSEGIATYPELPETPHHVGRLQD